MKTVLIPLLPLPPLIQQAHSYLSIHFCTFHNFLHSVVRGAVIIMWLFAMYANFTLYPQMTWGLVLTKHNAASIKMRITFPLLFLHTFVLVAVTGKNTHNEMKMVWLDTSGGDVREMEGFIEIVPCHCQHHRRRSPYCRVGHESSNVICISFEKMGQNVKCICICTEKVLQHSGTKGLKPWVLLKMTNADGKRSFIA